MAQNDIDLILQIKSNMDKTLQKIEQSFDSIENSGKSVVKSVDEMNKRLRKTTSLSVKTSKVFKSLAGTASKLAAGVSAATVAIGSFVGVKLAYEAIEAAASIEDLTTQFIAFTGSAEAANRQVEELRDFAAATPFRLAEIAKAARSLLAFGTEQGKVNERLTLLGDIAAGTGAELSELTRIFGQIQAAGKLTGERYLQLVERGINIGPVLAESLGVAESSLEDLRRAGKISADDVLTAFETMAGAGGMFEGSLQRLSQTSSGLFSTLQDNITNALANVGQIFEPITKQVLKFATDVAKEFGKFIKDNKQTLAVGFRDIAVDVLDTLAELTKGFSKNFKSMFRFVDTFVNLSSGSFKVFLNGIDTILLGVAKLVQGVAFLREKAGQFFGSSDIEQDAKKTQLIYENFADKLAKRLDERSKDIKKSFEDAFSFDEGERSLVNKVTNAVDVVEERIKKLANVIKNTEIKFAEPSQETVSSIVGPKGIFDTLTEWANAAVDAILRASAQVKKFAVGLASDLSSIFVSGTKDIRDNLDDIAEKDKQIQEKRAALEKTRINNLAEFDASKLKERKQIQEEIVALEKEKSDLAKGQKKSLMDAGAAAVSSVAGLITDAFLPGAGQFVTTLLELAKDPEAFKIFIKGFVDAIPGIIDALSESLPEITLVLIESMPQVAEALIKGIIKLIGNTGVVLAHAFVAGAGAFVNKLIASVGEIIRPISDLLKPIFDGFANVVDGLVSAFNRFAEVLTSFDPSKIGQGGTLGRALGGDIGGALGDIGGALGLASGGAVRVQGASGTRDTVPAMLADGELVVDRSTTAQLDKFLSNPTAMQAGGDSSILLPVLEAILAAIQSPVKVDNTIEFDGRALASIITNLKRNGQIS